MGLKKVLTYAGFWLIVLVGFYLAFWHPRIGRLRKLRDQVTTQQTVISQLRKDIESYPKTITAESLREVEENLENLFARIPAEEDIPVILKQIRQFSMKRAGLDVIKVTNATPKPDQDAPDSPIPQMQYQITIEGNTHDIIRFMYELESGVRLIAIKDFALRRINEEKYSVRADFTLSIFYSNLPDASPIVTRR